MDGVLSRIRERVASCPSKDVQNRAFQNIERLEDELGEGQLLRFWEIVDPKTLNLLISELYLEFLNFQDLVGSQDINEGLRLKLLNMR